MRISFGFLITLLRACPPEHRVSFDFPNMVPRELRSYRGYYEDLAFGFKEERYQGDRPTVADVLKMCEAVHGKTLEGYKGGDYLMGDGTRLWVADWGEASGVAVMGVADDGYETIIATARVE